MSMHPVRTALAVLLGASLAAPTAGAAPASVTADLSAQTGHHTGKASLDAAVVVRRGSFLRAGIAFDAAGTCANPGMMLTDVATGAMLRMPFVDRDEGAALTRLNSDALAMRAQRRCIGGALASCGFNQDKDGGTVFGATLNGHTFGTSVAINEDGQTLVVGAYDGGFKKQQPGDAELNSALAAAQYAELVSASGTPFYTVVVERAYDAAANEVRAALAVWLPEDMPIGAYTLSLACGQEVVGDGLPLVVLFNPFDVSTDEVAAAEIAKTVQAGRADVIQTPGLSTGFALSPPDQAAIDTLLEMIAAFPLAARRHPALVAQIAAKGRGPIQLTGRANYRGLRDGYPDSGSVDSSAKTGYDDGFIGGETNADVAIWKSAQAWNDATGHFDLWGGQLGKVGDGTWPYEGAARISVRGRVLSCSYGTGGGCLTGAKVKNPGSQFLSFQVAGKAAGNGHTLHGVQDSFASGHTLRFRTPGAVSPADAVYSIAADLVGEIGDDVEVTGLSANNGGLLTQIKLQGEIKKGADLKLDVYEVQGEYADFFDLLSKPGKGNKLAGKPSKYGQCWVFSGTLSSAAKADGGGVKYGQCWVFASAFSSLAAGGPKSKFAWVWNEGISSASGDFKAAFGDGSSPYTSVPFEGVVRSENGVVPSNGVWTWTGGTWSGTGSSNVNGGWKKGGGKGGTWTGTSAIEGKADGTFGVIGSWTFDDSAGQDSSKTIPVHTPIALTSAGHFIDDWQGETAYLKFDVGSSGTRVSATSSSGKTPDPLEGIVLHKAGTGASYGVDDVQITVLSESNPDKPITVTGTVLDTGSAFRAYRNGGRGVCHYGKCFCHAGYSEGLLRAAGIPTRSATNFDSAHESKGFQIPAGVGPSNAFVVRSTAKTEPGQPWFDFAPYASYIVQNGGNKDSIWNFHVWNEAAYKTAGESVWNFHVWTEAWLSASKGKAPDWNAYDATAQEESDGKVQAPGIGWGLDCSQGNCAKDPVVQLAAKLNGLPVDVLVDLLSKPRNAPSELLHGRWDGNYGDGKEPGTWDGAAKPTPKPGSGSATPADPKQPAEPAAPAAAAPAAKPAPAVPAADVQ